MSLSLCNYVAYGDIYRNCENDEVEVTKLPAFVKEEEELVQYDELREVGMLPTISVDESDDKENVIDVPAIPIAELREMTNDFNVRFLIANESSGGSLYHGVLQNGQHVAIKKLYKKSPLKIFLSKVQHILIRL